MMAHNVQETYGQSRFGDLAVCAKSGTAEVSDGAPHAWFVGFVDDSTLPLAFVVVVEHGGSGSELGAMAADILSYYFSAKQTQDEVPTENTLTR